MKNRLLTMMLAGAVLLLVACDTNKEDVRSATGSITIGTNAAMDIDFGVLTFEDNLGNGLYELELELFAGINETQWTQDYPVVTPIAELDIQLVSTNASSLPSGTYEYSISKRASTFFSADGIYAANGTLNYENDTYQKVVISSGTLTVTNNGGTYTLTFSGYNSSGTQVSATFNGTLIFFGSSDY